MALQTKRPLGVTRTREADRQCCEEIAIATLSLHVRPHELRLGHGAIQIARLSAQGERDAQCFAGPDNSASRPGRRQRGDMGIELRDRIGLALRDGPPEQSIHIGDPLGDGISGAAVEPGLFHRCSESRRFASC